MTWAGEFFIGGWEFSYGDITRIVDRYDRAAK